MLTAKFSCPKCGIKERQFPARERHPNEDSVAYIRHLVGEAGDVHAILAPLCPADRLDIYAPVTQNGVGVSGPELTDQDREELRRRLKK